MTFTEAAALVLRLVGKPLHYKEITDVAIERNLLSHVGKSPEVTMGARLNALIKKTDRDNPLVRVKPGVFALRDWDEKTIEDGLKDRTPALERVSEEALRQVEGLDLSHDGALAEIEDDTTPPDEEEKHRAELSASATELFASEDDDDKPIFGSDDEVDEEAKTAAGGNGADAAGEGRGRRRRRRRGRGRRDEETPENGEESEDDLPTYTVSDAGPSDGFVDELDVAEARTQQPRERSERGDRGERSERGDRGDRGDRSDRGDRGDRAERSDVAFDAELPEGGADLAQLLEKALGSYDRSRGPVAAQNLADGLRRRFKGDASLNAAALVALAQADNLRAEYEGRLPRFRILGAKLALTSWSLDRRSEEKQRGFLRAAEQLREGTLRALTEQLVQLPHRSVGELILVLLDRMGAKNVEFLRRPGAHGSEIHLSASFGGVGFGSSSFGPGPVKTAIVIRRDGRDVGRERVTELRGALHHYGPAGHGWLITTGQVLSGAREEAQSSGASPVSLTGRNELAELCLTFGVGVRPLRVEVPTVDLELFEGLSGR